MHCRMPFRITANVIKTHSSQKLRTVVDTSHNELINISCHSESGMYAFLLSFACISGVCVCVCVKHILCNPAAAVPSAHTSSTLQSKLMRNEEGANIPSSEFAWNSLVMRKKRIFPRNYFDGRCEREIRINSFFSILFSADSEVPLWLKIVRTCLCLFEKNTENINSLLDLLIANFRCAAHRRWRWITLSGAGNLYPFHKWNIGRISLLHFLIISATYFAVSRRAERIFGMSRNFSSQNEFTCSLGIIWYYMKEVELRIS